MTVLVTEYYVSFTVVRTTSSILIFRRFYTLTAKLGEIHGQLIMRCDVNLFTLRNTQYENRVMSRIKDAKEIL